MTTDMNHTPPLPPPKASSTRTTSTTNLTVDDDIESNDNLIIPITNEDGLQEVLTTTLPIHHEDGEEEEHRQHQHHISSTLRTTTIEPPISQMEHYRDMILRILDLPIFQYIGLLVLFGVIVTGALFFFLLLGAHTLCTPKTNCEPRNTIYNYSIQILNVFFTYMAFISLPWRISNFLHITQWNCPKRRNDIGCNLYGIPDPDLWFYVPIRTRFWITLILLCNCLFQFINHATRFVHISYEEQDTKPGNIWTNVFFVAAFVCAGIGGIWIAIVSSTLRYQYPNKFGYGPIDTIKHYYHQHFIPTICGYCCCCPMKYHMNDTGGDVTNEISNPHEVQQSENAFHHHEQIHATTTTMKHNITEMHHNEASLQQGSQQQDQNDQNHNNNNNIVSLNDPTRDVLRRSVFVEDRGAMRMFAM